MEIINQTLLLLLSLLPLLLWFLLYFKKRFIPFRTIPWTFLQGFLFCVLLYFAETMVVFRLWPELETYLFYTTSPPLWKSIILTYFIIAPLEEIPKFFILKRKIFHAKSVNQIIDGLQIGIVFGLGFAACENFLQLSALLSLKNFSLLKNVFIARFLISTLAHIIYSGVMGYYLALARFHKLYRVFLLPRALLAPLLLHSAYNFFIVFQLPWVSIAFLIVISLLVYKWYKTRKNFELQVTQRQIPIIFPFLAEKQETDVFLTKEKIAFDFLKKLK